MENKVICCCANVTEQDVRDAVKDGVKTFQELQEKTNIGMDCPPCKVSSEEFFNKVLEETSK